MSEHQATVLATLIMFELHNGIIDKSNIAEYCRIKDVAIDYAKQQAAKQQPTI